MESDSSTTPQVNTTQPVEKPVQAVNDHDYVDPNSKEVKNGVKPVNYLPSRKVSIVLLSLFLIISSAGLLITQLNTQKYRESLRSKQLLFPTSAPDQDAEQKPDNSPANWKTFYGDGYSIKYPDGNLFRATKLEKTDESPKQDVLMYLVKKIDRTDEGLKIQISKERSDRKDIFDYGKDFPFSSYIKIGNYDVLSLGSDTLPPDFCFNFSLLNNGYVYTLISPNLKVGSDRAESGCDHEKVGIDVDQILSTLKFQDQKCKVGEILKQCKSGPCCCPINAFCD